MTAIWGYIWAKKIKQVMLSQEKDKAVMIGHVGVNRKAT